MTRLNLISRLGRTVNRATANSTLGQRLLRTVPVTSDLAAISDIDHASEVDPREVGMKRSARDAIWRAAEDLYSTGYYPAIMVCLRRRGKIVLNRALGHARGFGEPGGPDTPVPVTTDTPACIYSASKSITAMLIHKLADEGKINLLDPVAYYVPEFGCHGKERLTVLQILAHRGGVPGIITERKLKELTRHETLLPLICAGRPLDPTGRTQAYHAITGGTILQAVLERVTGTSIADYWQAKFKRPMQLKHFEYGARGTAFETMARDAFTGARIPGGIRRYFQQYLGLDVEVDRDFINDPAFFSEPIPAGNMIATAEEASRFFQMLLDDGRYGARQLLSPLAVHRATWEVSSHQFDNVLKVPLRYSPGMMLGGDPVGLFGWKTPSAFGHLGLINIFIWADPERALSAAILTTGKPLLGHNLPYLTALLGSISRGIPRDARKRAL
jgi:CubicO group peptidase (beta-lactamase class C family)